MHVWPYIRSGRMASKAFLQDDFKLHKLCQEGNLDKIKDFVQKLDDDTLTEKLANKKSVFGHRFGYTPLQEAVASGKASVLDYLLERTKDVNVNCRSNGGFTLLHLAASSNHLDCVKILLNHGANVSATNKKGKTPKQMACELHSTKPSIIRLLACEEVAKEVETNGDRLTELLQNNSHYLEQDCLNRCLVAATKNNNYLNVGKLVIKGAKNFDECMALAVLENKPHARAMLLLIKAASTNNRAIVQKLFGEMVEKAESLTDQFSDPGFEDVQKAVLSGKVSTVVPIEIARRNGNLQVREELLLRTDVNKEEGYIYWHGLRLLQLEVSWLHKIIWVKHLKLAGNGFKTLPNDVGNYLKQVVKLDLQHNELTVIPRCLLELLSLGELNLAHNKLQEIPDVPEWSACLTVLILSHNQLSSLPINVVAPTIRSLDLSHNNFRTVPLCICSFVTLNSLDLSDNPDILTLPVEMGRLNMLAQLNLTNLKHLKDPPRNIQRDTRDCIRYLNTKLRCAKGFYKMKLMLVGLANRGKTTLVKRLQGKECSNESNVGIEVSEWWYKPSLGRKLFHFSIWDFGGQEEYYATHQCFLSQRSMYLLLFNLNDGDNGVQELKPWLNNIALRAPRSCVIIIGTHLDEVVEEKREEIDALLQRVGVLAESYSSKLQIVEVMPVGLKNRIENIALLKEAIYNHAANYKTKSGQVIMGQKIPASYHALDRQLESVQLEVRLGLREPIMHAKEFNTMVQQMNLADIQDEEELKTATLFLTDVGSLLHYDDRSHNLHELYFIDPRWLCDMMSKVVAIKKRNPFVKKGILYMKHIQLLFKDEVFPWRYFEQYLTLLDRFEIALPLDNRRILIPCMLSDDRPTKLIEDHFSNTVPVYSRYFIFNSAYTPPGLWSRLLSMIMHFISQISLKLDKTTLQDQVPDELFDFSGHNLGEPVQEDEEVSAKTLYTPEAQKIPIEHKTPQSQFATELSNLLLDSTKSESQDLDESSLTSSSSHRIKLEKANSYIPQLIPNFPNPLFSSAEHSDVKEFHLEYWKHGLFYKDPQVAFHIESLAKSGKLHNDRNEGILIMTSHNNPGKRMLGQLVDLVLSVINEWYPQVTEGFNSNNNLEQRVPCFECMKARRPKPFEFQVDQCLPIILKNETSIECGFYKDDCTKNHIVTLTDIVPDLLLQDVDPHFLLNPEDIQYQEDDASLLGKGGYGKVYRGTYRDRSVAIKKYLIRNEEAFSELRSEATLLQQCHHPCVVCIVGVSIHPEIHALVMEEAPYKSLDYSLLKNKISIHRLTIFRIAAEVAAAISYLHKKRIVYRNIRAANVLLWTLEPTSLCHCKVTDFGIATHMAPVGARGLVGSNYVAPEVLQFGKRKQRSTYDHMADIFLFGMFLYQIIARRHPQYHIPAHRIDVSIEEGVRPQLEDVDIAYTGYHYLTMLMKTCWEDNPRSRPTSDAIIKTVSTSAVQSVMCVFPVKSRFPLRRAIPITSADLVKAESLDILHNELWVCCDGAEGAELNVYNTNTMVKVNKNFIAESQVKCMTFCNDHVWVGSYAGIEYSTIDIFNIITRELVHNIRMKENFVSCMAAANDRVLIGTLEGYCFSFSSDIQSLRQKVKPRYKYVLEHAVDGIACIKDLIWVSYTNHIYFLNSENLALEGSISRDHNEEALIGPLSLAPAKDIVWSVHLGGIIMSAWDADNHVHMFDIDTYKVLNKLTANIKEHMVITAMVPVLDMTWVGMATGHILLFHGEELLTWYHPYSEFVSFLTVIPGSGPCEKEECLVVSGGNGLTHSFHNLGMDDNKTDKKEQLLDEAGVLVIWEGYNSKTIRQMNLIENSAPHHLETHSSVKHIIQTGEFLDGTNLL